jgi:hypothetical protein
MYRDDMETQAWRLLMPERRTFEQGLKEKNGGGSSPQKSSTEPESSTDCRLVLVTNQPVHRSSPR